MSLSSLIPPGTPLHPTFFSTLLTSYFSDEASPFDSSDPEISSLLLESHRLDNLISAREKFLNSHIPSDNASSRLSKQPPSVVALPLPHYAPSTIPASAWTMADSFAFERILEIDLALEVFATEKLNTLVDLPPQRLNNVAAVLAPVLAVADVEVSDEESLIHEPMSDEDEDAGQEVLQELEEIEEELKKVIE